jgi:hypothetical protein
MWLVALDATGAVATAEAGADVGLEKMPAPEVVRLTFRTFVISDFATLGDTQHIVAEGQRWESFNTTRCDAFTAAEVDGIWQVYSTEAREPLGSTRHSTLPVALEALGDQLVLLSQPLSNEYPKEVRVATTPPLK